MHRFLPVIPFWVRWLFPSYTWRMPAKEKQVYLTFDDGPHPQITPFVLDLLRQYGAKATFFCIGKNVALYPQVYRRILADGHAVGNHTHNHLNGWKTDTATYVQNVREAAALIQSSLFRPPYGRIRKQQARSVVHTLGAGSRIIMWDVLSADFDQGLKPEHCLRRVLRHTKPGSIVVFHDSEKAFPNLKAILPEVLRHLNAQGYSCRPIG